MEFSKKPKFATLAICGLLIVGAGVVAWRMIPGGGASAQQNAQRERVVAVAVGKAERKEMPFRIDAPGAVQPMVSVTIRARVDSQVDEVAFVDGAAVKINDVLFKLDTRAINAQIVQADAQLARDKASVEKAGRDVERISGLVTKGAASQVTLDDMRTNYDILKATVEQNKANLDNLRIQRTYYTITSPVSGRVGIAGVRAGAVVRSGDMLAVVNQFTPIYVGFGVPERYIPELRQAGSRAKVDVILQNGDTIGGGNVSFIENTVDPQTGTIMVRAAFQNSDERLWPGALVSARVFLRTDQDVVVIPNDAIQSGQRGSFVFVIENGIARLRPVTIVRTLDDESIVSEGLSGGETVVTDGQLNLRNGSRVDIKRQSGV